MKVNCSVTSCSFNKNRECYANAIKIGGKSAISETATCCGTFLNISAYSNIAEFTSMRGETNEIFCNAENCTHNKNDHCILSEINVGGVTESSIYTDTECDTFKKA